MSKKGDAIRIQIIESANRLFYKRGFQMASYADLAKESGIPKGNYYFHFKSKEALLDAVIYTRHQDLQSQLDHWEDTIKNPKDRLRRAVRMIEVERSALKSYGCPIGSLIAELVKSHPTQKKQLAKMLYLIESWMAEQIFSLTHNQTLSQRQARNMLGRMQGATTLVSAYGDDEVITEVIADLDLIISDL